MPISIPVVPAQPSQPYYGLVALQLFKVYTPESYQAEFGVAAPAFDTSRPVKGWFDTSVTGDPDDEVLYKVYRRSDSTGAGKITSLTLTVHEAQTVNLAPSWATTDPAFQSALKRVREVPIRDLLPGEILDTTASLGGSSVPMIRRAGATPSTDQSGFGPADRDLLGRIAAKLGA